MDFDLKITGGTVIDGHGAPGYMADIGIKNGCIGAIGSLQAATATEEIDASGLVVSPGFIDCHTHYDAQVLWDPMLSPSVYHGVTTVLSGNCGFTLAPLNGRREDSDYLLAMLSRVEGMPLTSLQAVVDPVWRSFGEYLDKIDGTVAINTAFMVGHSALRRHVMGDRAVGHTATDAEVAEMARLLRKSLVAGGVGFSTTTSTSHNDHNGDPVPSRWAKDDEILALASVVRDFPGTWLELLPGVEKSDPDRRYRLSTAMSLAAQRSVNWNSVVVRAQSPEVLEAQLEMGRHAKRHGAKVYGLVPAVPIKNVINFRTGLQLELLEHWHGFINLPHDQKIAAMKDPETRRRLQDGAEASFQYSGLPEDFGEITIEYAQSAKNAPLAGMLVRDYAAQVGKTAFDALFDLAIEEDLAMSFSPPGLGEDEESWKLRADVFRDEHCLIGASDAGAHVDAINTFAIPTQLLGESVRRRGIFSLEEGVRRITSLPAEVFGLKGRGSIAQGAAADLVVFDPDAIDCGPISMRNDLPAGETRLYAEAVGVHHVIVNGVNVAGDNKSTGHIGGKVLRSGTDTYTVPLN